MHQLKNNFLVRPVKQVPLTESAPIVYTLCVGANEASTRPSQVSSEREQAVGVYSSSVVTLAWTSRIVVVRWSSTPDTSVWNDDCCVALCAAIT